MQSWSKVKWVKVGVQTLLKITLLAYRKSCLAIIGPKSNEKLTKYEIRSSYCLIQFGFIPGVYLPLLDIKIPFLSIFIIAYLYLPRTTYILPYLDLITLIWSYKTNLAHNRLEKIFWPWKWDKNILASLKNPAPPPGSLMVAP